MRLVLSVLVFLLAWSSTPSVQAQSSERLPASTASAPTGFQPGDAVRITVWRNPELSGEFDIGADGTIVHPLYRTVRATGVPIPEVEAEIRKIIQQRFETNAELVVEPLFRISIGGEVRSPNLYTLSPATTIHQAITQAGGPTPRAQISRVRLLREGETVLVDLRRPAQELTYLRMRSGDQIIVDSRNNLWVDAISPALSAVGSVASLAWIFIRVLRY